MEEQWKEIELFKGYYAISNFGRVKSLQRTVMRSNGSVQTFKEKMLTLTNYSNGYIRTTLSMNGKYKDFLVHRLVAIAFVVNDDPSVKIEVNHKDGNKGNNFQDNLEWCTPSYNKKHAFSTGLNKQKLGEENPKSKLTDSQVLRIRELYSDGNTSYRKLAEMFGVGRTLISEVLNNKTRKLLEV